MKKQLLSLCIVFFVAQNNCSDNKILTLATGASACGAGFLARHSIKKRWLSPKIATIGGFGALAFNYAAQKFSPDTMKSIGVKLGLSIANQEFLAKLSPFASAAALGVGLAGTAWLIWDNNTRLHDSIRDNDPRGVQEWIDAGADIHAKYKYSIWNQRVWDNNQTPLEIAILNGWNRRSEAAKVLIKNGANINGRETFVLNWAIKEKCPESAKLLIERGADVNAVDNNGKTALIYAADDYFTNNANVDIVRLLIEHSTDVNITEQEHGATLLHMACFHGDVQTVKLLLNRGANVSAIDAYGKSPEDVARECNWPEIANLLAEKSNAKKDCNICLDSHPIKDFVRLHCGHEDTCKECMKKAIDFVLKERSTEGFVCTERECKDKCLTDTDLRSITGHNNIPQFEEYKEKINVIRTYEWIRSQQNAKQCTTPDCPFVFLANDNREAVRCEECKKEYCSHCMHPHANNWTCAQAKAVRDAENPDAVATAQLLAETTKPCPKCNANAERSSGCNHMQCGATGCSTHFCFNCGNKLEHPYYQSQAIGGTLLCGCPTWPSASSSS